MHTRPLHWTALSAMKPDKLVHTTVPADANAAFLSEFLNSSKVSNNCMVPTHGNRTGESWLRYDNDDVIYQ